MQKLMERGKHLFKHTLTQINVNSITRDKKSVSKSYL